MIRQSGLGLAYVLAACGAAPQVPEVAPASPEPPPREATAVAILEVAEPTAEELGGDAAAEHLPAPVAEALAVPQRTREEVLETWTLLLRSGWVRRRAGLVLGSEPSERDVAVTREDRRITLRVRADGWDGAVARCKVMVRAANEETGQGHATAREWLDEQRRHLEDELATIDSSLDDVPPERGLDPTEPVAVARAEVDQWRTVLSSLTVDAPLPDAVAGAAAPSLLMGLRAQAAGLARERAALATRYLDRHPQVRSLDARRSRLVDRFVAQRDRERAYFEALGRELEGNPRAGAARARLAALLATLQAPPTAGGEFVVPSAAATTLRALAHGVFAERQALVTLGERYGEHHPEIVAQQVRLEDVTRSLRDEVAREIAALSETIAAVDRARGRTRAETLARLAEPLDGRLRRASGLRATIRSLDRRARELARQPWVRYRVVEDCRAPRDAREPDGR